MMHCQDSMYCHMPNDPLCFKCNFGEMIFKRPYGGGLFSLVGGFQSRIVLLSSCKLVFGNGFSTHPVLVRNDRDTFH